MTRHSSIHDICHVAEIERQRLLPEDSLSPNSSLLSPGSSVDSSFFGSLSPTLRLSPTVQDNGTNSIKPFSPLPVLSESNKLNDIKVEKTINKLPLVISEAKTPRANVPSVQKNAKKSTCNNVLRLKLLSSELKSDISTKQVLKVKSRRKSKSMLSEMDQIIHQKGSAPEILNQSDVTKLVSSEPTKPETRHIHLSPSDGQVKINIPIAWILKICDPSSKLHTAGCHSASIIHYTNTTFKTVVQLEIICYVQTFVSLKILFYCTLVNIRRVLLDMYKKRTKIIYSKRLHGQFETGPQMMFTYY
ncbi:hypothetical protein GQR58_021251 [Nymphon striatum]|nr:hypothetical protein GQR58_021251 [Nymphon striatum]